MDSLYVESPEWYAGDRARPTAFLAGGITGCPDWQQEARKLLDGSGIALFNPRQSAFDMRDPTAGDAQIAWEHAHLRAADVRLFWFCKEALQPIACYELGAWSMVDAPLVVGCHPDYERQFDVVKQTALARPEVPVHDTLEMTCSALIRVAWKAFTARQAGA